MSQEESDGDEQQPTKVVAIDEVSAAALKKKEAQKLAFQSILVSLDYFDSGSPTPLLDVDNLVEEVTELPKRFDKDFALACISKFRVLSKYDQTDIIRRITDRRAERRGKQPPSKKEKRSSDEALKADFWALYRDVLGDLRRDIFSGDLLFRDSDGWWKPAVNGEDLIRSRAIEINQTGDLRFPLSYITPHMKALERATPARFIPDLPQWDGRDRVKELCDAVHLAPSAGITNEAFHDLLQEWLSLMWERMENPRVQNRIIVLKGGQGIGKDHWISALVDGAGQFSINLSIISHDKDTYIQLTRGLVLKISEFDRTSKQEASFIKDIITRPDVNVRRPYAAEAEQKWCRCSFIASCNVDDILKDETGNRRYLVFTVDSIDWNYPNTEEDRRQVLAQARELAKARHRASKATNQQMAHYLNEWKPTSFADEVEELWNEVSKQAFEKLPDPEQRVIMRLGFIPNSSSREILLAMEKHVRRSPAQIRKHLKQRGYESRESETRGLSASWLKGWDVQGAAGSGDAGGIDEVYF